MGRFCQQLFSKKNVLGLLAIFMSTSVAFCQCDCEQDFEQLDKLLQKTPAFKDNKAKYQNTYHLLKQELPKVTSDFECLLLLNKLSLGVKDNHIKVFALNNELQPKPMKAKVDLDSLQMVLKNRPLESVEGIYSLPNYVTLGLYKNNNDFYGVILSSELPNWERGDIMYAMHPYGEDFFLVVFGQSKTKRFVAVSERIKKGMFLKLGIKKDLSIASVHRTPHRDSLYVRKELNEHITYLKVGSFESFYPTLSDAEAFYGGLKGNLSKPNIILDLRDNSGGGERNSNILLELLKTNTIKNNLFVLTNHNTGSNAEQFTVKLKSLPNTSILGDRTLGAIAYELKKNISNELPCNKFVAIMTSKRHKTYLPFESKGVTPDVMLNYDTDWIEQTIEFISSSND